MKEDSRRRAIARGCSEPAVWLGLVIVLLALTFTSPSLTLERNLFRHLFVFDITQSMNVRDVGGSDRPMSRLGLSKEMVRQAMSRLPCGSEAGIAIFTEHRAFLLLAPVEVCAHFGEISTITDNLNWRMAWRERSEVAKGLYSSLSMAKLLGQGTSLVFITDGHEAPPVHSAFRPEFSGGPGDVKGMVIGVGGLNPSAIPKFDPQGRFQGYWAADEVMQVDSFTQGRAGSVGGEQMVGVSPNEYASGQEHLSALREPYLRQLAGELKLRYHRLEAYDALFELMVAPEFAVRESVRTDLRWLFALSALLILLGVYAAAPVALTVRYLLRSLSNSGLIYCGKANLVRFTDPSR